MMRSLHEKIIPVILVLLAINNLIFFIVSSYSGPIIGFVIGIGIAIHWWIKRYSPVIIGTAIVWIVFHIYEYITLGPGSNPVFFYLNLLLPIPLLFYSSEAYITTKKERK